MIYEYNSGRGIETAVSSASSSAGVNSSRNDNNNNNASKHFGCKPLSGPDVAPQRPCEISTRHCSITTIAMYNPAPQRGLGGRKRPFGGATLNLGQRAAMFFVVSCCCRPRIRVEHKFRVLCGRRSSWLASGPYHAARLTSPRTCPVLVRESPPWPGPVRQPSIEPKEGRETADSSGSKGSFCTLLTLMIMTRV